LRSLDKLPRQRTHSALCFRNLIRSQRKMQPAAIIIINFVSQRNITALLRHDYLTETVRSPIPRSSDSFLRVSPRARRALQALLRSKASTPPSCLAPPPPYHGNQLDQAVDRQQPPSTCQASSRTVRHPAPNFCSSSYVAASLAQTC
jgi:hypothetical protein